MNSQFGMQCLPLEERPRERLLRYGPESMSTSELLAILIGSGMKGKPVLQLAQELVAQFGTLGDLAEASVEELCAIKGLGQAKAIQLKAAFSLGAKMARQPRPPRYRIDQPLHVYQLLKEEMENLKHEQFVVVLQDSKGYLIRQEIVAVGTLNRTLVHPREVLYPAIRHKAASFILAHNHPSGDPTPSKEDLDVTQKLQAACSLVGIRLNDHLIIGKDRYQSLRQLGRL